MVGGGGQWQGSACGHAEAGHYRWPARGTGPPIAKQLNPARRRWRARERAELSGEEAQAAPDLVLVDDGGGVPVADAMLVS